VCCVVNQVNGAPGLIAQGGSGRTLAAISFALRGDRITDIWVTRNPDKLTTWNRSLGPPAEWVPGFGIWPDRPTHPVSFTRYRAQTCR